MLPGGGTGKLVGIDADFVDLLQAEGIEEIGVDTSQVDGFLTTGNEREMQTLVSVLVCRVDTYIV